MSTAMDRDLGQLLEELRHVPEVYRPSPFWEQLASANVRQLEDSGFDNFKRTVNTRYFNWRLLGIVRHQLLAVANEWLKSPSSELLTARFLQPTLASTDRAASFGPVSAWLYKTFVAMFADVLRRRDQLALLESLEEPQLGNPFLVSYRGRQISQDLCNSIHELYSLLGDCGVPSVGTPNPSFAELGAGYGRLAYVVLKSQPCVRYCVIDIPPALYLSQRYLTALFPDLPVFRFRPFSTYREIADDFQKARIRFLAPHQIELIPDKSFDYFVNVSSLHEMTVPQVSNYFRHIDRLCRGHFYTKQWRVSRTPINGCTWREHDYPVPSSWRTLFHRRHPIQRMFFHALYEVGQPVASSVMLPPNPLTAELG